MTRRASLLRRAWVRSEASMPPADFERYVSAPLGPTEIRDAKALMDWFRHHYSTPAERLNYARHAWAAALRLADVPFPAAAIADDASTGGPPRLLPTFAASTDELALDLEVIEWFLWHRGGRGRPVDERPIGRWLRNYGRYARAADTGPDAIAELEAPEDAEVEHRNLSVMADVYGSRLLAWSIRTLETSRGAAVDASFVRDEICGTDASEEGALLRMPGGVGTLYLAARCVRAGGGTVLVHGGTPGKDGAKRFDVEWSPAGGVVAFERKDRAFFRSAAQSGEQVGRWLADCLADTRRAPKQLAVAPPRALKVASAGAVLSAGGIDAALQRLREDVPSVVDRLRSLPLDARPDALVVVLFGYGVRDGLVDARFAPVCCPIAEDRSNPAWGDLHAAFERAI